MRNIKRVLFILFPGAGRQTCTCKEEAVKTEASQAVRETHQTVAIVFPCSILVKSGQATCMHDLLT